MSQFPPTQTFTHPLLGSLTGLLSSSTPHVTHFRSIPYATIPARFKQSELLCSIPSSHSRDFTRYGTTCPCPPQLDQIEASGGPLEEESDRVWDEDSLGVTISAPTAVLGTGAELAVMVYVHGGGFTVGSGHVSALCDTRRLVELSIQEGHPVIIVSIHYRTNWFGFLACEDLLNEAKSLNTPALNFGLHDQRTAFLWTHNFISGFGGTTSVSKITAFGESAGSASLALHMCSSIPLFSRAILMSGTTATAPPVDIKYKEAEYKALLKFFDIGENDCDRLEQLRQVPREKLVEAINGVGGIPIFTTWKDPEFFERGFPNVWSEGSLIGGCEWVDEVVIGDSFFEGWLFADALKRVDLQAFISFSFSALGTTNANNLLDAYEITYSMHENTFWNQLLYLTGDLMFSAPTHSLALSLSSSSTTSSSLGPSSKSQHKKKKIYRYHQTLRNPFPGSGMHQVPGHHFIELLFLFGTLMERYPPGKRLREVSKEYGKRWLAFANGEAPWAEFEGGKEGRIMVIGGDGKGGFQERSRREDEEISAQSSEGERRYKAWEFIMSIMGSFDEVKGAEVRMRWGTDGGFWRLAGVKGPYGVVLP